MGKGKLTMVDSSDQAGHELAGAIARASITDGASEVVVRERDVSAEMLGVALVALGEILGSVVHAAAQSTQALIRAGIDRGDLPEPDDRDASDLLEMILANHNTYRQLRDLGDGTP